MRHRIARAGLFITGLAVITVAANVCAQQGLGRGRPGSGSWGPDSEYGRLFNPKTVETLEGEVVSIEYNTPRRASGRGVHLMLQTEKETIAVHLGPAWFIENQDIQIEKEDKINVTGSRVNYEGKPALIAAEIQKDDETLELRNDQGFPRWAGWRGR